MDYWNKDNFEGLAAIAAELEGDPRLSGLAAYCRLRADGLREKAFEALNGFLDHAQTLPAGEQRALVHAIYDIGLGAPAAHQFLSTPLEKRLLHPGLDAWLADEPECLDALRWDGIFRGNGQSLEKALALDAGDVKLRRRLIAGECLARVDHAVHHIHESALLMEPGEIEALLDRGEAWLEAAPDVSPFEDLAGEIAEYRRLVEDWKTFEESGATSFPEWCEKTGRRHRWGATFYYET